MFLGCNWSLAPQMDVPESSLDQNLLDRTGLVAEMASLACVIGFILAFGHWVIDLLGTDGDPLPNWVLTHDWPELPLLPYSLQSCKFFSVSELCSERGNGHCVLRKGSPMGGHLQMRVLWLLWKESGSILSSALVFSRGIPGSM